MLYSERDEAPPGILAKPSDVADEELAECGIPGTLLTERQFGMFELPLGLLLTSERQLGITGAERQLGIMPQARIS